MAWPNNPAPTDNFNIPPEDAVYKSGIYSKSIHIPISTTFFATGSNQGAAAVLVTNGDVTLTLSGGGSITGSALDAGVIHDIGIVKVVTGGAGIVDILYSSR